jgi:hypothetical protein
MTNTYSQISIHAVFAVKGRENFIIGFVLFSKCFLLPKYLPYRAPAELNLLLFLLLNNPLERAEILASLSIQGVCDSTQKLANCDAATLLKGPTNTATQVYPAHRMAWQAIPGTVFPAAQTPTPPMVVLFVARP